MKLEVPQKYVPLVALYSLSDGLPNPYHLEDIALESKKISPNSFSWTKYKENIDLRQVMRSLDVLKKEGLISGKNTTAWTLTSSGISIVTGFELERTSVITSPKKKRGIFSSEIERILSSDAFNNWVESGEVSKTSALRLLRLDQYSSDNQVSANITRFEQASKNTEVEEFIIKIIELIRNGERL